MVVWKLSNCINWVLSETFIMRKIEFRIHHRLLKQRTLFLYGGQCSDLCTFLSILVTFLWYCLVSVIPFPRVSIFTLQGYWWVKTGVPIWPLWLRVYEPLQIQVAESHRSQVWIPLGTHNFEYKMKSYLLEVYMRF